MTSSKPRKIKLKKTPAAVRLSRQPKPFDPDLSTPALTAASATVSETDSTPQYSPHISPYISPAIQPTSILSSSMAFPPMLSSERPMDFNPFLLPSVAYPSYHPMNPQAFAPNPVALNQKVKATRKKKADSRVVFSDEASIISDDKGSTTSRTTTEEDVSESDHTEKDKHNRNHRKPAAVEKRRKREPTKVPDQKRTSVRSVTSTANSKAVQVRRRRGPDASRSTVSRPTSRVAEEEEFESEPDDLMGRISSAIPDLHLLLTKYKETNGELSLKDQVRMRLEAEQAELVKSKEDTIISLMQQLEESAKDHANETSQLRSKITTLERNQAQFPEHMANAENRIKSAETRMKSFEEGEKRVTRLNEQYIVERASFAKRAAEETEKALVKQRDKLLEEFGRERDKLIEGFGRERDKLLDEFERERDSLKSRLESGKREMEDRLSQQQKDLEDRAQKEKEEYEVQSQKARGDIEAQLTKEKEELETKVADQDKQLDEMGRTDSEVRGKLDQEYSEKEAELTKKHEGEIEALKEHHKDYVNEQMRGFVSIQELLNKTLTEENATLRSLLAGHQLNPSPPSASVEDAD